MASTLFDTEIENENMFEIELEQNENNNNNEKFPIEIFQELETEPLDILLQRENNDGLSDDETDGPIDFIRQIVDNVREEFDGVVEEGDRKKFLHLLTKSVKADSIEKIISLVKLTVSKVVKTWSERN